MCMITDNKYYFPFFSQTRPPEWTYQAGSHNRETPQVPGNNQDLYIMYRPLVLICKNGVKVFISVFQICNASFATRDRLRSHLACHEDKIPCKVCGKFLRAAYMTDHLKKHSEGTHNYCGICNKGNYLKYLSMHLTVPLKQLCPYKYSVDTEVMDIQRVKTCCNPVLVFGWFCCVLTKVQR